MSPAGREHYLEKPGDWMARFVATLLSPDRTKEIRVHANEVADHWEEKKL
jgi:hypothetical protein